MTNRNSVAVRDAKFPHMARLPTGKAVLATDAAALGFHVVSAEEGAQRKAEDATQAAKDARIEQFTSLPEARGKVRSAARLAASNPDMTAAEARTWLRGAHSDAEIATQRQALATPTATAPAAPFVTYGDDTMSSTPTVDKAKRRAELGNAMKGMQGVRVPLRELAGAPDTAPQVVDREARRAELSALGKRMLGTR